MTVMSIRDVSLHVQTFGAGDPLVLMHGGPGADMYTMLPFRKLADRRQLIFYDHRCNGRSNGGDVTSMSWENLTADAEALRQLGFGERRRQTLSKPRQGHFEKGGVSPKRYLHESRVDAETLEQHEVGGNVQVDIFEAGQRVERQQAGDGVHTVAFGNGGQVEGQAAIPLDQLPLGRNGDAIEAHPRQQGLDLAWRQGRIARSQQGSDPSHVRAGEGRPGEPPGHGPPETHRGRFPWSEVRTTTESPPRRPDSRRR